MLQCMFRTQKVKITTKHPYENKGVFKRMITRKNINASTVDQAANMIESLDTDLISNLEI